MKKYTLILMVLLLFLLGTSGAFDIGDNDKSPKPTPIVVVDKPIKDKDIKVYLKKQGIDENKVQLEESFTAEHPTSEIYRNIETGDVIESFSSIPRINQDGQFIQPYWISYAGFSFSDSDWDAATNTFTAKVIGTEVKVDYNGERCWWNPELYLDGKRIQPVSQTATLIDDPYNENYHQNTITWDYGICVREIRLIEGALFEKWVFPSDPQGKILIKHRQGGVHQLGFGLLYDSAGMQLPVEIQQNDWEIVAASTFNNPDAEYPLYLGASATYYVTYNAAVASYPTPASANTWADLRADAGDWGGYLGAYWGSAANWQCFTTINTFQNLLRSLYIFDASSLDDTVTITSATMSLRGYTKSDPQSNNPRINIYAATSLSNTGIDKTDYSRITATAWSNTPIALGNVTAGWSITGYNDWILNVAGLAGISKTALTKIGTREVTYDVGGAVPTWASGYVTEFGTYFLAQGTGYEPKLVVTYTPVIPDISAQAATSISNHAARLNSVINVAGGELCDVRFGYGTTSQTADNFELYDVRTAWVAGYTTGEHPYYDATGLTNNQLYHFRVQIKNTSGNDTSDEIDFTTTNNLEAPYNFTGFPLATSINLSWIPGGGAGNTLVRYSYETYPGNTTAGNLVYFGTGRSKTLSGLTPGSTIYLSAWGESGGNYSTYVTLMMTTSFDDSTASTTTDPPSMPFGWFQAPDYTKLSHLPFYGGLNSVSDGMNMPRATFWILFVMACIVIIATPVVFVAGVSAALLAGIMLMVAFTVIGILPAVLLFGILIFAIGIGGLRWRLEA